jgi:hypothetical protein
MAQIAIAFHYEGNTPDDHYRQVIVEADKEADAMIREIKEHWEDFQKTRPDTDDFFFDYLEQRGYRTLDGEPIALVLNG